MKSRRPIGAAFALTSLLVAVASTSARTWTDRQGNTIEAKFIRVHGENVVLRRGQQVAQVPYAGLTVTDRDYVAELLDERGEGDKLPPLGKSRHWRDGDGNTIDARFVRVKDGHVVLWKSGEVRALPFEKFSPADRKYVRDGLTKLARADMLPPAEDDEKALNKPPAPLPKRPAPPRPRPKVHKSPQSPYRPPRPPIEIKRELRCTICNRKAPPGARVADRCQYCVAESKKRQERMLAMRRQDGQVRIKSLPTPPTSSPAKATTRQSNEFTAYNLGQVTGFIVLGLLVLIGGSKLFRLLMP